MTMILLFLVPMAIGLWAQSQVSRRFRQYSEVPLSSGMTGAEVARAILDRNGLREVPVRETPGELSDHYDPRDRTVNLSEPVYSSRSVAAVAVAAHEVGHALQHQKSYAPMALRSAMVPVATLGTNLASWLLMGGLVLAYMGSQFGRNVLLIGILLYLGAVLFTVVTLPVEFNASSRAKRQLRELGFVSDPGSDGTSKVLGAAAMTYVAAALAAITQLLYFVMAYLGSDE